MTDPKADSPGPPSLSPNSEERQQAVPPPSEIRVAQPDWLATTVDWERPYRTTVDRMRLALDLAAGNVAAATGGPFGAAVFELETGRLVAVGVNSVVRLNNAALHAEVVALMFAQYRRGSHSLAAPDLPDHELVSSAEPCAMCLGAVLWSGVRRLVSGATRADVSRLGFDEGPVYAASYDHLRRRGIQLEHEVLRPEAQVVLEAYRQAGGIVYNG